MTGAAAFNGNLFTLNLSLQPGVARGFHDKVQRKLRRQINQEHRSASAGNGIIANCENAGHSSDAESESYCLAPAENGINVKDTSAGHISDAEIKFSARQTEQISESNFSASTSSHAGISRPIFF